MAGVKGKSGGPRANAGGARPGAGRKPKSAPGGVEVSLERQPNGGALKRAKSTPVELPPMDMLEMLQAVALGKVEATVTQVRAAIAAVQYTHTKKGEGGKKQEQKDKAIAAGQGRFGAPPPPPRLVHSGGK